MEKTVKDVFDGQEKPSESPQGERLTGKRAWCIGLATGPSEHYYRVHRRLMLRWKTPSNRARTDWNVQEVPTNPQTRRGEHAPGELD